MTISNTNLKTTSAILKKRLSFPNRIPLWAKYLLALVPIIWIFSKIDFLEMFHVFGKIAWWTIPFLIAVIILSMFLQGVRWWMLLKAFIPAIRFSRVLNHHFSAIFYSIILPTSAAQDIVRSVLISKENDYGISWGSTWVSRILGLLTLAILSIYGLFLIDRHFLPKSFFLTLVIVFVALIVLFFLSFSKKITSRTRPVLSKLMPLKALTIIEDVRQGVYIYRGKKKTLFFVFLATMFIQLLLVGSTCLVLAGISGKWFPFECLAYVPLIEILSLSIPLTPSGLGIREALTKLMFQQIGLSNEQLGVYIVLGLLSILLKLVGGVPVLFNLLQKPNPQRNQPQSHQTE